MFTLEQKINICLEYISTHDLNRLVELRKLAAEALESTDSTTNSIPNSNDIPTIDLEDMIDDLLKDLGAPCDLAGYDGLACCIKLVVMDKTYLTQIVDRLYFDAANRVGTTVSRLERRMRHVVERIFDCGNMYNVQSVFGNTIRSDSGKLTNSEFIAASAKEIRRRAKHAGVTI